MMDLHAFDLTNTGSVFNSFFEPDGTWGAKSGKY
jgi:hypothetical protein